MKRITNTLAILLFALCFSPLNAQDGGEDSRKLSDFEEIAISISAEVTYEQGKDPGVEIKGNAKDVSKLITEVEGDVLKIKYPRGYRAKSRLSIHVGSAGLSGLRISGSADFKAKTLKTEDLSVGLSGSGGVSLGELRAEEVNVAISGSASVELENGNADEMQVSISGSGKVRAENYTVNEMKARISGSGSIWITVSEELDVKTSGSGSVHYHGEPRVNAISSGSGKIKAL